MKKILLFSFLFLLPVGLAIFNINEFVLDEKNNASFYIINPANQIDCSCNCSADIDFNNGTPVISDGQVIRQECKYTLEVNNTNFPEVDDYFINMTCICPDGIWSNYPGIRIMDNVAEVGLELLTDSFFDESLVSQQCISNTALRVNSSYTFCVDGNCELKEKVDTISCTYGCDTNNNQCYESRFKRLLIIFGIIAFMIFAYLFFRWLGG